MNRSIFCVIETGVLKSKPYLNLKKIKKSHWLEKLGSYLRTPCPVSRDYLIHTPPPLSVAHLCFSFNELYCCSFFPLILSFKLPELFSGIFPTVLTAGSGFFYRSKLDYHDNGTIILPLCYTLRTEGQRNSKLLCSKAYMTLITSPPLHILPLTKIRVIICSVWVFLGDEAN